MSTHANMVKMTTATTGTGTITLGSASSGFQSFADAYGANATVDVLITDGTAWEVARNCTYTHSGTTLTRGTLEDSSTGAALNLTGAAVVSVVATADFGNQLEKQLDRGYTFITNANTVDQALSGATTTKITILNNEENDPNGWWDTTNDQFLPDRQGSYLIIAGAQFDTGVTVNQPFLYKNAAVDTTGAIFNATPCACSVTSIVSLNGSTDYVDFRIYLGAGATTNSDAGRVYFKAIFLGP